MRLTKGGYEGGRKIGKKNKAQVHERRIGREEVRKQKQERRDENDEGRRRRRRMNNKSRFQ